MNRSKKRDENWLTTRPLMGKIIIFALPLMLTSILQLLYNLADIIVLGKFASNASAGAVGSTSALVALVTGLFLGLSVGASASAAKWIGSNNMARLDKVVHTAIILALIFGFGMGAIGVIFARDFLVLMNTPESVLPLSTLYLRIFFGGMPFNFLYNFASALLRAQGDTKRPLIFLFLAGIVNVILNLVLVIVAKMDVAGVATGTIVAQALSAVMAVTYLFKQKGPCKLYFSHFKFDKMAAIEIFKIGMPAGLEGSIFSISNVIIQSAINSFGDIILTANAEVASLEGFIYMSMNAVTQACLTVTSQNYGAGKTKNIDIAGINSIIITSVIGLVMGLTMYFASDTMMLMFTDSPEIIAVAKQRMLAIAVPYFLCGIMEIPVSLMRGMGHSLAPMIVSLVGVCGFRILYIYTIFRAHHDLMTLYISYPISWIITTIAHSICLVFIRHKEYKKINEIKARTLKEMLDREAAGLE